MNLEEKLAAMCEAARQAGDTVKRKHGFRVERKAAMNDFVTEMDLLSEKMLREALLGRYPEDAFYGEEGGQTGERRGRFIVDPIDGTTNYIHGIVPYTVSVAYELDGVIELGCVYCPITGELFQARRGHGAYLDGERLRVRREPLSEAVVGTSFAHRSEAGRARMLRLFPELCASVNDLRRLGSAAYDLCLVAAGRYGAFMELGLNLYDFAAGMLMVTEAGGVVTGWDEDEDFRVTGNILSGSGEIVAELTPILRRSR